MQPKILVDTNVIVAASINENVQELNAPVKHDFHDESIHLFGIFKRRLSERIGIITSTIESESFYTLNTAVNSIITKNVSDIELKRKLFDHAVAIINLCEDKMRKLISVLLREPISETDFAKNLSLVDKMCEDVKSTWEQKYATRELREKESWERARPILNEPKWRGDMKQDVIRIHRQQVEREAVQLKRFVDGYPHLSDRKILAEAISIAKYYCKISGITFFIASCDMGFFSPYRVKSGVHSDIVTKEIKKRFDISCDFPYKIIQEIEQKTNKTPAS